MKKTSLFSTIFVVLATISLYLLMTEKPPAPKLLKVRIIGLSSVPENTQNIYRITAVYNNGSNVEVTADADINIVAKECKVVILGGIVETFNLEYAQEYFTIHANYRNMTAEKMVVIHRQQRQENEKVITFNIKTTPEF